MIDINIYLDETGKIKTWPSKMIKKVEILKYLSTRFDTNKIYTEKEVNTIISENHTFNDYFLLRRELIDHHFLKRTPNDAKYWKEEIISGI